MDSQVIGIRFSLHLHAEINENDIALGRCEQDFRLGKTRKVEAYLFLR